MCSAYVWLALVFIFRSGFQTLSKEYDKESETKTVQNVFQAKTEHLEPILSTS